MSSEKCDGVIANEPAAQDRVGGGLGMASLPTAQAMIQVAPTDFRSGPVQSVSVADVPPPAQVTKTESKS